MTRIVFILIAMVWNGVATAEVVPAEVEFCIHEQNVKEYAGRGIIRVQTFRYCNQTNVYLEFQCRDRSSGKWHWCRLDMGAELWEIQPVVPYPHPVIVFIEEFE